MKYTNDEGKYLYVNFALSPEVGSHGEVPIEGSVEVLYGKIPMEGSVEVLLFSVYGEIPMEGSVEVLFFSVYVDVVH